MQLKVSDVTFRDDLYPRSEIDSAKVQEYAETIDLLPPIEVNQNNEGIDGKHRWTAHKKAKRETIEVIVTKTTSDSHLLELAIERNAKHGLQLSMNDKQDMARKIYGMTPDSGKDEKKKYLAEILAVGERTIRDWLSRIDKDSKAARDRKIRAMWLACYTDVEIGKAVGLSKPQMTEITSKFGIGSLAKTELSAAEHATSFDQSLATVPRGGRLDLVTLPLTNHKPPCGHLLGGVTIFWHRRAGAFSREPRR